MSRLYQYANSNNKTGLYLLDGYKGNNSTFQVGSLAEKLFEYLDYQPGIRNQKQGPRIPDELHWGLFDVGWIYTNESGLSPPTNDAGELVIEGDSVEITEDIANDLERFLKQTEGDDIEDLADILNLDISDEMKNEGESTGASASPVTHIWKASISRCEEFAAQVTMQLEQELQREGKECSFDLIQGEKSVFDGVQKSVVTIQIRESTQRNSEYLLVAYFCPEHGFEKVATATDGDCSWNNRIQLEKHRQRFIESIISTAIEENVDIGDPGADLNLRTDYDSPVFD